MARSLASIAQEIEIVWGARGKGVNYAARPYLDAMATLISVDDPYYAEDGKTQVIYFLNNASSFQGERAKEIKNELRVMLGWKPVK
jgi:hypothetical protein